MWIVSTPFLFFEFVIQFPALVPLPTSQVPQFTFFPNLFASESNRFDRLVKKFIGFGNRFANPGKRIAVLLAPFVESVKKFGKSAKWFPESGKNFGPSSMKLVSEAKDLHFQANEVIHFMIYWPFLLTHPTPLVLHFTKKPERFVSGLCQVLNQVPFIS
ncbi:hypothetical protein D0X99_07100 [Algoriphagus lacus]|uniref:Uncharacterized protein n=1 Tax=Algoriphagus lacus TaxID=2056311 RepID=A0A418PV77_9BACT|nr:hypothetical protein D0X99_07100 [Algoriphagus lacus]